MKSLFPELFELEANKCYNIRARFSLNTGQGPKWIWHWSNMGVADRLSAQITVLEGLLQHVQLSNKEDRWKWEGDTSGIFTATSMQLILENLFFNPYGRKTLWNNLLPQRLTVSFGEFY